MQAKTRKERERLERLDDGGVALGAAAAQGGSAGAATAATQFVDQVQEDAVAAHPDGVAQGDGAAVDVGDLVGDAQVVHRRQADGGEGLVELEEVDVGDLLADLV